MNNDMQGILFGKAVELLGELNYNYYNLYDMILKVCEFIEVENIFIYESVLTSNTMQLVGNYSLTGNGEMPSIIECPNPNNLHSAVFEKVNKPSILVSATDLNRNVIGFTGAILVSDKHYSDIEEQTLIYILKFVASFIRLKFFQKNMENASETLERILDNTGIDIYVNDYYTHELLYANKSVASAFGGYEKIKGKKCHEAFCGGLTEKCDFCPEEHLLENGEVNISGSYKWDFNRPIDGLWFRVHNSAFRWIDGRLAHIVSAVDITDNKKNEELIYKMAFFDALTEIPNRRKFEIDFNAALDRAKLGESRGYLLFLDLDNFKYINDAFGHEIGDGVLKGFSSYVYNHKEFGKHIYRFGGDEFIMFFEQVDEDWIRRITQEMLVRFRQPWVISGTDYFCTASIGIAEFPKNGITYNELLLSADNTMYKVKKSNKGSLAFSEPENVTKTEKLEKEFAMRRSFANNFSDFKILVFPVINTKDNCRVGFDTIVLWDSPIYGVQYMRDFMGLCEEMGLVGQFVEWVLTEVISNAVEKKLLDNEKFIACVSLPAMHLMQDSFSEFLTDLLEKYNYPPSRLILEVYESSLEAYAESYSDYLSRIKKIGVLISLDCFRKGYSSFRWDAFEFDFIKINHAFVKQFKQINTSDFKEAILKSLPDFAHKAGMKITAEGVYDEVTKMFLIDNGYDYLEGRYLHGPVPFEDFHM